MSLAAPVQYGAGGPRHRCEPRKKKEKTKFRKEAKLCLFADDTIMQVGNSKQCTKQPQKPTSEFSEVIECKVSIKKNLSYSNVSSK